MASSKLARATVGNEADSNVMLGDGPVATSSMVHVPICLRVGSGNSTLTQLVAGLQVSCQNYVMVFILNATRLGALIGGVKGRLKIKQMNV